MAECSRRREDKLEWTAATALCLELMFTLCWPLLFLPLHTCRDALQRKDAHASHGAVLWVGKYRLYRQEEERSSARRKLFGDGDESVQHDAGRQQHFSRAAARSHRPTSAPSTL